MVKHSKKVNKKLIDEDRVEVIEESVEKTIFSDDFLDLVTAIETYYFWPSFSDASKEIRRLLKNSGNLLFVNEMLRMVGTKLNVLRRLRKQMCILSHWTKSGIFCTQLVSMMFKLSRKLNPYGILFSLRNVK